MRAPRSILVLRPDRLGDVIVSTPVQQLLRERYPNARLIWLVQDWIAPLLEGLPGMTSVIRYQPRTRHAGFSGWSTLVRELRAVEADAVVALQSTPRVSSAARAAGIPWRVGPLSKAHSFFLYNHGLRQKRSDSIRHEAEYGMELLSRLPGWGDRAPDFTTARARGPQVTISPAALEWAREWCVAREISRGEAIGLHPGMGGSALNWPFAKYIELARALLLDGRKVVVTAGAGEEEMATRLVAACGDLVGNAMARVHVCSARTDGMGLPRLAALQSLLAGFVAPSTGPLHLASSVGTPVVSVYPPIQVQHPDRWGPYVAGARARVLVPVTREECGERFKCRGSACKFYPCMERVSSDDVLKAVTQLAARG